MSGRRRIKRNDGRSPSQSATEKRLTPSDIRRREARKAERSALAAQGMLPQQPKAFRCFVNRQQPNDAIFESPNSQQDLNKEMCSHWIETPSEHVGNRLAVAVNNMELWAEELVASGWMRL
jgi:hypothetical protein